MLATIACVLTLMTGAGEARPVQPIAQAAPGSRVRLPEWHPGTGSPGTVPPEAPEDPALSWSVWWARNGALHLSRPESRSIGNNCYIGRRLPLLIEGRLQAPVASLPSERPIEGRGARDLRWTRWWRFNGPPVVTDPFDEAPAPGESKRGGRWWDDRGFCSHGPVWLDTNAYAPVGNRPGIGGYASGAR